MDSEVEHSAPEEEIDEGDNHIRLELKAEERDSDFELSSEEASSVSEHADPSPIGDDYSERSPLKRSASGLEHSFHPFKRQRGVFNNDYLDLLNRDIEDAAQHVCLEDEAANLLPSQLGLTLWSPLEKKLFFEAVARLGKHDLSGIASRVGSKSVVEVNQYIHVLQQASDQRRQTDGRSILEIAELPAAAELSQQCCHAQEEAADAISVRQERREQQREEEKWGGNWDITAKVARKLDSAQDTTKKSDSAPKSASGEQLPSSQLFHLSQWLQLSQRIFMNSSIPGDNWNFFDNTPPSMWATSFEDFHSLAVSMTRRLVQTTLFISMSRIRAKSELQPSTKRVVRKSDVEAAIASLSLPSNTNEFWRKSARRLRLSVYEEPPLRENDDDEEPMTYEDVESALFDEPTETAPELTAGVWDLESLPDDDEYPDEWSHESESDDSNLLHDEGESEINEEANEVLEHSAADFPATYRTKQALKSRIAMERQQDQYAERCDEHASYVAEAEMWDLLQKRPPMEIPKRQDPGPVSRSTKDVESIYPIGRHWRDKLEYYSEWETIGTPKDSEPGPI